MQTFFFKFLSHFTFLTFLNFNIRDRLSVCGDTWRSWQVRRIWMYIELAEESTSLWDTSERPQNTSCPPTSFTTPSEWCKQVDFVAFSYEQQIVISCHLIFYFSDLS